MSTQRRDGLLDGIGTSIGHVQDLAAWYRDRFDHPFLFSLLPLAGLLLVLGAVAQTAGWTVGAGFMALFAVKFVFLWTIGYGALLALVHGRRGLRQWRVRERDSV